MYTACVVHKSLLKKTGQLINQYLAIFRLSVLADNYVCLSTEMFISLHFKMYKLYLSVDSKQFLFLSKIVCVYHIRPPSSLDMVTGHLKHILIIMYLFSAEVYSTKN